MSATIRREEPHDIAAIRALAAAAFAGVRHSDGSEPRVIDALRAAGELALSLVAEEDGQMVGHVAFSPVAISDGSMNWFGLGPVSVAPRCQRRGIGSALIERGIADLREAGARGVVLLGEPGYYCRFGFEHDPALRFPGPPPRYFQRLVLAGEAPTGIVRYSAAFG